MSIRHDLVLKALAGECTITELAKEHRKTAHKWVARFRGRGLKRSAIAHSLEQTGRNWAKTARRLGMDRGNLHHVARRLGVPLVR